MPYEVTTETYRGPLDKLLELIEEKKLEITQLNLAEVTADFLAYIEKLGKSAEGVGVPPGILADFLVVASRLILIKSKALLPSLALTEEEEQETVDLEHRLILYREFKEAQKYLAGGWHAVPEMFSREFLMASEAAFYPPQRITVPDLAAAFRRILGELERFAKPSGHIRAETLTLKNKIEEVLKRLTRASLKFSELGGSRSRGEIAMLFLAVLHLLKTQLVRAEQERRFGDIVIAKRGKNP